MGMNALWTEFSSSGFQVLGFPSNVFNLQEPSKTADELLNGIKYVRPGGGYVPMFQMFQKIDVNGANEHALYTYLKSVCGPTADQFEDDLFYDPKRVSDVRWNFEIFLVDQKGKILYRYSPDHDLSLVRDDIRKLFTAKPKESNTKKKENTKRKKNPTSPTY
ncbi:hypothetical protein DPMN_032322 [Dreissena polymorpha]|uniref:Glutathione peroxidase n=3 Tax=Dreissena polymorpha TaxID=45954 RepID=A0A9D4RHV2_DREPO|nr:hypothetical protein DPMN_032322 [Dreissena polymorpha]